MSIKHLLLILSLSINSFLVYSQDIDTTANESNTGSQIEEKKEAEKEDTSKDSTQTPEVIPDETKTKDVSPKEKVVNPEANDSERILVDESKETEINEIAVSKIDTKDMIFIPEGKFTMGRKGGFMREEEAPEHEVELSDFYIDAKEVTNEAYRKCVIANKCRSSEYEHNDRYNRSQFPVVGVDWDDARSYCTFVGKRLPTEAEWEKAARGTDKRHYCWGKRFSIYGKKKYANVFGDYDGYLRSAPVGSFELGVSPYGVHDMCGNVAEWTADYFSRLYYQNSPQKDPTGPKDGENRVVRGGSWKNTPPNITTTYRDHEYSDRRAKDLGFRCAVSE